MTPQEAADLAARTLAAIEAEGHFLVADHNAANVERVASDLTGIERHQKPYSTAPGCSTCMTWPCPDSKSYANRLIRTAALYGVTP